jgi:hypothetical protein
MLPILAGAEPRLQRRYHQLLVSELSPHDRLAAGVHAPPGITLPFAATQAAWRFYANEQVTLPMLATPLVELAKASVPRVCDRYCLCVIDWSLLHLKTHHAKADRMEMSRHDDLGYELLTALLVSDQNGMPIAPACLELQSRNGTYTTRSDRLQKPLSQLDALEPVMDHTQALDLGKPLVFIIDREADSLAHYRSWIQSGKRFLIRANERRWAKHEGAEKRLGGWADNLPLKFSREVLHHGRPARQFTGEMQVMLDRPAYQHRVIPGKRRLRKTVVIPGEPVQVRLIVSEVRDEAGKVLSRWLLLSNLPPEVDGSTAALWYYWRWTIESYHKLLKSAGRHVEQWQQESATSFSRRLLVTAMSVVLAWQLARETHPKAEALRHTLMRLSGRQTKRGKDAPGFSIPGLIAGLAVLMPMLALLETTPLEELRSMVRDLLPLLDSG